MMDSGSADIVASPSSTPRFGAAWWIALGVIAALGFGLRYHDLDRSSFWYDEIRSMTAAALPLDQVHTGIATNKPPLHYYILHFALRLLGESERAGRMPSCIWGTLAILASAWLTGLLLRGFGRRREAMLSAAALTACSAFMLRYSQEARPYMLFLLATMLAQGCFLTALHTPAESRGWRWQWLGGFVAASIVGAGTLYFALIFLAANALFAAAWVWRRPNALDAEDGKRAAGLDWAPLLATLIALAAAALFPVLRRGAVGEALSEEPWENFGEWSWSSIFRQSNIFGIGYHEWDIIWLPWNTPASLFFIPFAAWGLIQLWRKRPWLGAYVALHCPVTLAALLLFFKLKDHWVSSRYLIHLFSLYYAVLALGCAEAGVAWLKCLPSLPRRLAVSSALCAFSLTLIFIQPSERWNWRALAQFVRDAGPETALIVPDGLELYCCQYYCKRMELPNPLINPGMSLERLKEAAAQHERFVIVTYPDHDYAMFQWLSQFGQLDRRHFQIDAWHNFPPEELGQLPGVKERALGAWRNGLTIAIGDESFACIGPGWDLRDIPDRNRPEAYRYGTAQTSEIWLWLPEVHHFRVRTRAQAFIYPGMQPQAFTLRVNGREAGRIALGDEFGQASLTVHASMFRPGLNRLEFEFDTCMRISEVYGDYYPESRADVRMRSALFDWIRLEPIREDEIVYPALVDQQRTWMMGEDAPDFIGAGWGLAEKNDGSGYRWAVSKQAHARFHLREVGPLRLTLRCDPLFYPDWPGQSIRLSLNGQDAGRLELKQGMQEYSVSLPEQALVEGSNELTFEFEHCPAVQDVLPGAQDARTLAVCFEWLRLERLSANGIEQ
ncbi:glycosyltransferase family 39 protein [Candidatus Sumerlaeota bacterium]|nr:glycosyltransferase family 39 protein [Candidatus Sumerlaeota bacterium]